MGAVSLPPPRFTAASSVRTCTVLVWLRSIRGLFTFAGSST
jgi:hypothetical protein